MIILVLKIKLCIFRKYSGKNILESWKPVGYPQLIWRNTGVLSPFGLELLKKPVIMIFRLTDFDDKNHVSITGYLRSTCKSSFSKFKYTF